MSAPKQVAIPTSPDPDKKYLGTVVLLTAISDKGYVCSTTVLRSVSKEVDEKAETVVREWHFEPASRKGRAVPVAVLVEVNYWTTKTGENCERSTQTLIHDCSGLRDRDITLDFIAQHDRLREFLHRFAFLPALPL